MICATISWSYTYNHGFGISIKENFQAVFFLVVTPSKYFSLSLLHCRFIPSFRFFSLFGNSSLFSFFSFISLKSFFLSFLATLQTKFFINIMTGLETSVAHNMLGNIHNSSPSVFRHESALGIEHSCPMLYLHS